MHQLHETEILQKLLKYCAYQERNEQQVRLKLLNLKASVSIQNKIIRFLKENNYLNEARYAQAQIRGKLRQNKWGKLKIKRHLQSKNIGNDIIANEMIEINEDEYLATIEKLIDRKLKQLELEEDVFIKRNKVFRHLASKGFESEHILNILNKKL